MNITAADIDSALMGVVLDRPRYSPAAVAVRATLDIAGGAAMGYGADEFEAIFDLRETLVFNVEHNGRLV